MFGIKRKRKLAKKSKKILQEKDKKEYAMLKVVDAVDEWELTSRYISFYISKRSLLLKGMDLKKGDFVLMSLAKA